MRGSLRLNARWRASAVGLILALLWGPPLGLAARKARDPSASRDSWQRPEEVMDALGAKAGSAVADVGAGEGYFTFHLAERVGPTGKIYAEDIEPKRLKKIRSRAKKKRLAQIETIAGSPDDPRLPSETLDAILVVDAFHEMTKYDAMLQSIHRALRPGGLLGIVDRKADPGQPRSYYHQHHRIPKELVLEDLTRNGFTLLREERGFQGPREPQNYYFLIFEKAKPAAKPQ